jgi:hypothetical protein
LQQHLIHLQYLSMNSKRLPSGMSISAALSYSAA